MEVHQRVGVAVLLFLSLAACTPKSTDAVFPESVTYSVGCTEDSIPTEYIVQWEDGRISLESSSGAEVFKSSFIQPRLNEIKYVEFNKKIRINPTVVQNAQSQIAPADNGLVDWGQDAIEARAVWDLGLKGQGVKVGVVDTAMDVTHPQLQRRLAVNEAELNGETDVDDDQNGFVDDVVGWDFLYDEPQGVRPVVDSHGTHVAGIVAADHRDGVIQGIAPEAQIVASSFLNEAGAGNLYGALLALDYVAAQGATVVNASWGGPNCSKTLRETLLRLSSDDVLIVVAAGNDGLNLDISPDYPAAFETPNQLTVGAIRPTGYMAGFSNTSYRFVHLAAPGEQIFSTVPRNGVAAMDGTSMAAPFVAGAAAVLRGHRPTATAAQVRQALLESVDKGNYRVQTQGRLNLRKAVERLEALIPLN